MDAGGTTVNETAAREGNQTPAVNPALVETAANGHPTGTNVQTKVNMANVDKATRVKGNALLAVPTRARVPKATAGTKNKRQNHPVALFIPLRC